MPFTIAEIIAAKGYVFEALGSLILLILRNEVIALLRTY